MTATPFSIDSIPETREQAIALLKNYEWDFSELTKEQQTAVRMLFNLDACGQVAKALERGRGS